MTIFKNIEIFLPFCIAIGLGTYLVSDYAINQQTRSTSIIRKVKFLGADAPTISETELEPTSHNFQRKLAMKTKLLSLSFALACAFSNTALAMTQVEYKTQKDTISGDYKVSRDKCESLKANAKDICISEAKGVEKIAKAELEASYEPTVRHTEKVGIAKGDAAYDTAKEKCDDVSGNAKTICKKEAKAIHVTALDEARVARVSAETGKTNTDMRNMANKDENEANYKAAAARCDSMSGASKDTCASETKLKFGIK